MKERIGLNEYGPLRRVVLRHAREAFGGPEAIAASWRELNYLAAPDYGRALADYDRFAEILTAGGAEIDWLPAAKGLALDSLYVHDAALPGPQGIVLCNMGKAARAQEPAAMERAFEGLGLPIAGRIEGEGRLEGGDLVWFDAKTCAVARGYRTNDAGIAQLKALPQGARRSHPQTGGCRAAHWFGPQYLAPCGDAGGPDPVR